MIKVIFLFSDDAEIGCGDKYNRTRIEKKFFLEKNIYILKLQK